jgi:hypothetical protein
VDRHLGNPKRPQSWNRYSYVANNPLAYIDPEGALRLRAIGGSGGTFEVAFTTGFGSAVADELRRDLPDLGGMAAQVVKRLPGGAAANAARILFSASDAALGAPTFSHDAFSEQLRDVSFERFLSESLREIQGTSFLTGQATKADLSALHEVAVSKIEDLRFSGAISDRDAARLKLRFNLRNLMAQAEAEKRRAEEQRRKMMEELEERLGRLQPR